MRLTCILILVFLSACDSDSVDEQPVLIVVSGDNQSADQFDVLPEPVRLRLLQGDNGVADVELVVTVTAGGGVVSGGRFETDENGYAELVWELGGGYHQELRVSQAEYETESRVVRATARYAYAEPDQLSDGWPVARIDTEDVGWALIQDAADGIRSGDWPEIHSLLVVLDDSLVFELYQPGRNSAGQLVQFDAGTLHEAQSATKSFRSAMIGIAIDHGFIRDVDTPVVDFFPGLDIDRTPEKESITLHHLLTMSTGLTWNETSGASGNSLNQMYSLPPGDWAKWVLSREVTDQPGSRFVYNTGTSILQALIVAQASGISWPTFVETYYSNIVENTAPAGIGWTLGGEMLPRDMARLGQVYLRDGLWKDRRVVSEEWIEQSIVPYFTVNDADASYGYQWWIRTYYTPDGPVDSYYAAGNGGQFIIVVDELDLVVVFTGGNFGTTLSGQAHELMRTMIIPGIRRIAR